MAACPVCQASRFCRCKKPDVNSVVAESLGGETVAAELYLADDPPAEDPKPNPPVIEVIMADSNCISTTGLPFVYDSPGEARDTIREVASSARHGVRETSDGVQKILKDHSDSDRHMGASFERVQKDRCDESRWSAKNFSDLHKDRTDKAEWDNERARDILTAVERNGRSAELATEKTAAATQLALKDMLKDVLLDSAKNAAAAALCCCETEARIAASTAAILSELKNSEAAELRRQLTVFQIRAVPGTGSSPV